jgi:hypothetical protein
MILAFRQRSGSITKMAVWVWCTTSGQSFLYGMNWTTLKCIARALILQYISHASVQIYHVQSFTLMSSYVCEHSMIVSSHAHSLFIALLGQLFTPSLDTHRTSRSVRARPGITRLCYLSTAFCSALTNPA